MAQDSEELEGKVEAPDVANIIIRRFDSRDSLTELTVWFVVPTSSSPKKGSAIWQDETITAKRIAGRECFVAELEGALVGRLR